nr:vesicle-associated protein 2-2-like isoform X1 [Ipomoea batatas]
MKLLVRKYYELQIIAGPAIVTANDAADDVFGSAKFTALPELAKNMDLKQENGKELVDTKLLQSKSRKDVEELESFKEFMPNDGD